MVVERTSGRWRRERGEQPGATLAGTGSGRDRTGPDLLRRGAALAVIASLLTVSGACGGEDASEDGTADRTAERRSAPASGDSPRASDGSPLLRPGSEAMTATAPDTFRVRFETSEGPFVVEAFRPWARRGADRFYNLVRHGFYDGNHFFRVLDGFVAQFGISGDPRISSAWRSARIRDDSVRASNVRGTITFATSGPDTRTTQLFVNLGDNSRLDTLGFAPFGRVVEGMQVVDSLYSGYGEGAPRGSGPAQPLIQRRGNEYLRAEFPRLDSIVHAEVVEP